MKPLPMPNRALHNKLLRKRKEKEIYLGINTNINCLDNWCPESSYRIKNHKIGLYLGKITFHKNRQSNLAPKYTPSNVADIEQQVKRVNPLWLDEINAKYTAPETHFDDMIGAYVLYNPNNAKVLCKNSDKNITLTKDQIISYFTELHKLNTTFIKDYIDSINEDNGIRAYTNIYLLYDDLLKQGILQRDMFEWYGEGKKRGTTITRLATLDYLKQTKQSNFKILLYDELFYAYFVYSLKEYTILYHEGYMIEANKLLFNSSAYIDDVESEDDDTQSSNQNTANHINNTEDNITLEDIGRERTYCRNAYLINPNDGFFHIIANNYIPTDEKGYSSFKSPNEAHNEKYIPFSPSPLGHYYFMLEDNPGTFIEFFPRIYPNTPPKHWNKEMMQKLDLKLE